MKNRKLYIEFVGISGSGKTTIAKKLYELLSSHLYVVKLPYDDNLSKTRFVHKLLILFQYYFKRPKSVFQCLILYYSSKYNYKGSLYTLLRKKYRIEKYFSLNHHDIILNKEGSLQLYRTNGDRITKTHSIPSYHNILSAEAHGYYPVLVNIELDIAVAVDRCNKSRTSKIKPEKWSLFQHSKNEQYELLKNWNRNKNIVVRKIESFGVQVIQIDSSHPIEKCVSEILNHL